MLFTTPEFIIFFISVLAVISAIKFRRFQHLFIVGSSYFFFYFSNNYLITLLIFSTLLDFYVGKAIFAAKDKKRKKILLITSLAGNLGLLGFFKYADFAILQFNILGQELNLNPDIPFLNLALPIGISFYTFQTITYTVDIYREKLKPSDSVWEFALFVSFFPQLVAGPILRASHFLPQLREKISNNNISTRLRTITIHDTALRFGITLMAMGFFKKMFFADNVAPMVNEIFNVPYGLESFSVIIGAIAFGVQIYCDFSGYSDIAIGAAIILGFNIPANFNKPFFATSPSDYWSRWHISLSTWVRDYVYYPLVFKHRRSSIVVFSSLLFSMLLMGLWHGASWNFLIWGGLHGIFLAVFTVLRKKYYKPTEPFFKSKFGKIFSIIITQYLVFFTFIAFRVQDLDALPYLFYKYLVWDFAINETVQILSHNQIPIILIVGFFILHYISYKKNIVKTLSEIKIVYWMGILLGMMTLILFFYDLSPEEFIYFRF
jgi:alginate O-acetyltransferase complex protein AlgI